MSALSPILLIGGGTMGEILLQGLIKQVSVDDITVAESVVERASYLQETYNVRVLPLNVELAASANTIILAVKPQDCQVVAEEISSGLHGQLIVSIMAGVASERLVNEFKSSRVVRAMPNTPAQIGLGITVWTTSIDVTDEDSGFVQSLLSAFGEEIYVNHDDDVDKATAVSASGPAYVFLFTEQLIQAAIELGLSPDIAAKLVKQTVRGAGELVHISPDSPQILRKKVTSKKGTTDAALSSLQLSELQTAWTQAIRAAYLRAKELSDGTKRS